MRDKEIIFKKNILFIITIKFLLLFLFSSEYSSKLFLPFLNVYMDGYFNPWQYYYENNLNLDSFPYHGLMLHVFSIPSIFIKTLAIENPILVNFIFKFPLFIADFTIFFILLKLFAHKQNKIILFYLLNPIIIYSTYVHSQLDIIPIALLMVSLYFLMKEKLLYFSVFLGLALSTKLNILIVIPLLFFYLLKQYGIKKGLLFTLIPFNILFLFDLPYLFSDGFLEMVLFNSKQSLLFDSYYKIGNLELLLPVAAITTVYLHFLNQNKVNHDLLFFYFGILFTATIFFIYPAPAWYIWLVPFMTIYFIQNKNEDKSKLLYFGFSTIYLIFFIFFYQSEYKDILFLNKTLDFKVDNINLINLSFTLLEITLLSIMYAFYKYGIKSNAVYQKIENLTIGIGGDSGVGKTTLLNSLESILGDKLLQIEGDGEHKWERGDENWEKYTHLDPKANHIHKQAEAVYTLKLNNSIKRSEYDHHTGKFTDALLIKPKEFIAISGLHPFYLPKLRKVIDLKIYMDTDEELRRHWKIIRDTKNRGYSLEKILKQIESRMSDAKKYIYPQKAFSDLIIRYFSINEFTPGDEQEDIKLGLIITLDANIHIENILNKLECQFTWDYNDDLKTQFIELTTIPKINYEDIMIDTIINEDEIISADIKWKTGYEGFIQLILLKMISEKLKEI